jgi:hypothetical protein
VLIPGVHVETVKNPVLYTPRQIENAAAIASALNRGRFVLAEPPAKR